MDNQPQETPQNPQPEAFVEIRYIGLGGLESASKRGSLMLFVPSDLYKDFIRDKERSNVPILPIPVPPFSEGLYNRRLAVAAGDEDPDSDILEGYLRAAGVRIRRITLRSATQGIYGLMTVVTEEGVEADLPINFEYTIVEAVLAKIPILIEQKLFQYILSQIKVDARFPSEGRDQDPDREPHTAEDDLAEEAEEFEDYLRRRIDEQSDPSSEDPEIRKQLAGYEEDELMALLDRSLEKEAYEWTDFLHLILKLKKGDPE